MRHYLLLLAVIALSGCMAPGGPRPNGVTALSSAQIFDGGGYPVEVCDASYVGKPAACTISGSGSSLAINGNIISDGKIYVGGKLLIGNDGKILAAGCRVPQKAAVTVDCPGALVSAGFINLHEHIDYSYQQPAKPPMGS